MKTLGLWRAQQSLKPTAHLKAVNIVLHAFDNHAILAGNAMLHQSIKQAHVCNCCWNRLERNAVGPFKRCRVFLASCSAIILKGVHLSEPMRSDIELRAYKAEFTVLYIWLQQVLDCMALEHVLKDLHAL